MKNFITFLLLLVFSYAGAQNLPKREFRGAWIHTVGNQQFKTMSADSIKQLFIKVFVKLAG